MKVYKYKYQEEHILVEMPSTFDKKTGEIFVQGHRIVPSPARIIVRMNDMLFEEMDFENCNGMRELHKGVLLVEIQENNFIAA